MLAELFLEMLQRDFGYRIYKMLLSLPEKVVAPPEPEKEEVVAKEEDAVKEEAAKESKDEVQSEGTAAESDAPPVSTSAPCLGMGLTSCQAELGCCMVPAGLFCFMGLLWLHLYCMWLVTLLKPWALPCSHSVVYLGEGKGRRHS